MNITPTIVKGKLNSAISAVSDVSWMYSKDPESDFTRERTAADRSGPESPPGGFQ